MVHLLGGAGSVQVAHGEDGGGEGVLAGVGGSLGRSIFRGRGGRSGSAAECGERRVEPLGESLLVVEIAVGARGYAGGTETLQPGVKVLAALAELDVVGVAERADREAHGGQRPVASGLERGVQGLGVVRRFAVAVGAGDDQDVLLGGQFGDVGLRHVEDGGGEAALAGFLGGFLGQTLGGAGLRAEEDGQGLQGGRLGAERRRLRGRGAREDAGEETVEPGALFGREGRGVGNERGGSHGQERSSCSSLTEWRRDHWTKVSPVLQRLW